ncbi:uncharacterized protein EDB91DRAFT_1258477 [Suillus paluster]|uniref:uncharacterized protein n=1 Tax=Suillus paluster TaxID=48578 RepID=UPI001B87EAC5|nr:uncharacterized protein EDB91DRAFT_1258477 [Suillus paluster]KAG1718557.1 hypothetical protein EDB91DRAFT_1258477 [Suillus paluster]
MEADYAMKKLMEAKNGRLRQQLFGQKQNSPRREGGSGSRHMTCNDMLDALAKANWTANIKVVHTEAAKKFRGIRQEHDQRAAAKEATKAVKTVMTLAAKCIADAQKAAKRELVLARKAEEAAAKKATVEAKCSAAAAANENEDSLNHGSENLNLIDDNTLKPLQPSNIRPRPRPRPILHRVNNPLPDLHLHVVQVQSPTNVQKSVLDGEDDAHAAAAANADSVIVDKGQPV